VSVKPVAVMTDVSLPDLLSYAISFSTPHQLNTCSFPFGVMSIFKGIEVTLFVVSHKHSKGNGYLFKQINLHFGFLKCTMQKHHNTHSLNKCVSVCVAMQ